jgi:lipopolysaccharide transport system permease protein
MTAAAEPLVEAAPRGPAAGSSTDGWVIDARAPGWRARLRELRQYRHLLRFLAIEAVRRSYRKTILGRFWLVLRPVLPVVVAAFVFGGLLQIPTEGVPYFLFFLASQAQWSLFGHGWTWSTRSLIRNRKLIRQLYFPRLFVPLAALAPAVLIFGIQFVMVILTLGYYRIAHGRSYLGPVLGWGWILVSMTLTAALTFFLGLWTSVLASRFRDAMYAVRYAERGIFLLTPVLYPLSAAPERLRPYVRLNPLAGLAEAFRFGLFGVGEVSWATLLPACVAVIVVGFTSLRYFFHVDASIADRI